MAHINSTFTFRYIDREKVFKTTLNINDKKASQQNDIPITVLWEFVYNCSYICYYNFKKTLFS